MHEQQDSHYEVEMYLGYGDLENEVAVDLFEVQGIEDIINVAFDEFVIPNRGSYDIPALMDVVVQKWNARSNDVNLPEFDGLKLLENPRSVYWSQGTNTFRFEVAIGSDFKDYADEHI